MYHDLQWHRNKINSFFMLYLATKRWFWWVTVINGEVFDSSDLYQHISELLISKPVRGRRKTRNVSWNLGKKIQIAALYILDIQTDMVRVEKNESTSNTLPHTLLKIHTVGMFAKAI